jgi:hypothetical protein
MADHAGQMVKWGEVFQGFRVYEFVGAGGPTAQRIYDTGNSVWVYYAPTPITDAPAPGDTTPNHSGTLDASSHQVI